MFPYKTFVQTYTSKSPMTQSGNGLFSKSYIPEFSWIGFYPGIIKNNTDVIIHRQHIMGCLSNKHVIEADANIYHGVHMINEANDKLSANVFYIKLTNGACLYFAGRDIYKNEELLTCYSETYGKRKYKISKKCADPRCFGSQHRKESLPLKEWIPKLIKKIPPKINYSEISNEILLMKEYIRNSQ